MQILKRCIKIPLSEDCEATYRTRTIHSSDTHEEDPAPEPPESLKNRGDVSQLVQQMAGAAAPAATDDDALVETARQTSTTAKYESPKRLDACLLAGPRKRSDCRPDRLAC